MTNFATGTRKWAASPRRDRAGSPTSWRPIATEPMPRRGGGVAEIQRGNSSAAGWLALAASPTFALMAWVGSSGAPMNAICSSDAGILPMNGMTAMYLLMSLFHLSPWLKLASGQPGRAACI